MKRLVALFVFLLFSLAYHVFALAESHQNGKIFFNTKQASQVFEDIRGKLKTPLVDLPALILSVKQIERLQDNAEACVQQSSEQLNALQKLTQLGDSLKLQRADHQYLQDKRLFYAQQLSECQFFVYRLQQALMNYKEIIQKLSAHKLLQQSTPIWEIDVKAMSASFKNIEAKKIYLISGIRGVTLSQLVLGLISLAVGLFFAAYLRIMCKRWLSNHKEAHPCAFSFMATVSQCIIPLILLGILTVFFHTIYKSQVPISTLLLVSYSFLIFTFLFALSKYTLGPNNKASNLFGFPPNIGRRLHTWFIILISWVLFGYVVAAIFRNQDLLPAFVDLIHTVFITVLSFLIAWFLWLVCRIFLIKRVRNEAFGMTQFMIIVLLLILIATEWSGYHQLSAFIINGLLWTGILVATTVGLWHLIDALYQLFDNKDFLVAVKTRAFFGIKPHKQSNEILLVKILLYFILLCAFVIALMKIWWVSPHAVDDVVNGLLEGFTIAQLKIIPTRIVLAVFSFSIILLVGRLIATRVSRRQQFDREKDTQVAVASIIIYVAFAIALLFALMMMGVNFTGIAIIAGALSVGVGFGLQGIVNNFISGVILLIEKPIKPGDRVIVGKTEGFVRKIRIRSTQIMTLAKEDVIVPNADLITNQVTNYMFRDHHWRVVCRVGVAYGSDVALVKEVLLDIASKHSGVVQEAPNKPTVLFRSFGQSSLLFELWCIIQDVNKKFAIESDLNYAINAVFKQNKITIAFPQRDVHIKDHAAVRQT